MTIDFHAHPVTDTFQQALAELGIDPIEDDGFPLPSWDIKAHETFMDEAEIDYTVLSAPTPHIHSGDDAASCRAARQINEELSGLCREHGDRFAFTAVLPLPCVEGAVEEARFAMDELGAAGMGMMETVDAQAEFEHLYFDIAGDPEPVALDMLRMVARDDHIVFGSDYPHSPAKVVLRKKQHFDANPKWNGLREQIYAGQGLVNIWASSKG